MLFTNFVSSVSRPAPSVTSAFGLAVAIPIVAILEWPERRAEGLARAISSIVTRVFAVARLPATSPKSSVWRVGAHG